MVDTDEVRRRRVADAIRSYLSRHPDAADNAEGIAKWWLREVGVETSVADTEWALAHLHGLGLIDKQVLPDGRALYRASRSPRNGT